MSKKTISIILILCVILVIGLFLIIKNMNQSKVMPESIDGKTAQNQLLLSGIGVFSEKYSGYYKSKDITQKLEALTKQDIPNLYNKIKKMDDSKLEKYYEENKSEIRKVFGKTDANEFKNFAKNLQNINTKLNTWYSLNIDRDSFKDESEQKAYSYVEYTVSYSNDNVLSFAIYIARRANQNPEFIVDVKN